MTGLRTLLLIAFALAGSQVAVAADAPLAQVTAGGSGEVHIPPTRATFSVSVETTAQTSAAAAAENARVTKDVTSALLGAGVPREELKASRLNVNAVWDYPKSGERRRRGYVATNSLEVETKQLEKLGVFIDTSLEAGATSVSSPNFSADDRGVARRQALALAVAAARDDAETIAKASGGTLGDLLDAGTEGAAYAGAPAPMMAMSRTAGASTEVITSDIAVSAHVSMRWTFIPARH
jgi:uncharacterized protein YggE